MRNVIFVIYGDLGIPTPKDFRGDTVNLSRIYLTVYPEIESIENCLSNKLPILAQANYIRTYAGSETTKVSSKLRNANRVLLRKSRRMEERKR
ncbi:hypothetical protein AC249_AIPGENE25312 [Exaiptasia diaphana]|nr:hypothetical protein AC249_AIPGENE25312 [Exaiptasia diaphana]